MGYDASSDSRIGDLERRIESLEAWNGALETRLEDLTYAPELTRRRALLGLMGGGALIGAGALYQEGTGPTTSPPRSPNASEATNTSRSGSTRSPSATGGEVRYVPMGEDLNRVLERVEPEETIVLARGEHVVESPLRRDVNDLRLIGRGREATTISRSGDFPLLELVGTDEDRRTGWTVANLTFDAGGRTAADLVRSKKTSDHTFFNVRFDAGETTGSSVYCNEAWDWNFERCYFSRGGTQRTGADVYLYNDSTDNSNHFNFVDCRFEPVLGHAIYLDSSGDGSTNGRLRLVNCKFHGQQPENNDDPDRYRIDGDYNVLELVNCQFIWSKRGFIRQRSGNSLQVSNCHFQYHDGPAIDVQGEGACLIGNSFLGNFDLTRPADRGQEAIVVNGSHNTIIGNNASGDGGIRVTGSDCAVVGNVVDTPAANPLVLAGTNVKAVANVATQR